MTTYTFVVRRVQQSDPVEISAATFEEARDQAIEFAEQEFYSDQWETVEATAEEDKP